ncbi:glycoside hydrolase family 57 protein [Fulvivirgaceae bacterium BMA10]|uniref:Glycoside hydrolase family 57 protein n=1 Tax=Splendidivirga corallicola TaxID=3051826 RepID=A0ABT8KHL7_9BACT|nr:glycoside hydrolase family 57 protein [Fulvivirgaceae bacterium BMA10]
MASVCFYFQVHQPFRIKPYSFFEIGEINNYEFEQQNIDILNGVSERCYLPTNELLLHLIEKSKGGFKIAFSISGTALEQFEKYRPDVLESFQKLAATGCVEFLAETYYHSLSFNFSINQFKHEVSKHRLKIERLFKQVPRVFRNTELIYNNDVAKVVEDMGFSGILCEGVDWFLNGASPNFLYSPPNAEHIKCFLKNHKLSDDIAFRFSNEAWNQFPLTAPKFSNWLGDLQNHSDIINLFMDYETFGEHQHAESGIFNFLSCLPEEILKHEWLDTKTPSEILTHFESKGIYDVESFTSWADLERDLSAWMGNNLQRDALNRLYELGKSISLIKNKALYDTWCKLQTSDHFYYMCTKSLADGDVHQYFSSFDSPYDAYIYYMNLLKDLELTINYEKEIQKVEKSTSKIV